MFHFLLQINKSQILYRPDTGHRGWRVTCRCTSLLARNV